MSLYNSSSIIRTECKKFHTLFRTMRITNGASYSKWVQIRQFFDKSANRNSFLGGKTRVLTSLPVAATRNADSVRCLSTSPASLKFCTDHISRGNFAEINDSDLGFFKRLLDKNQVITDQDELASYNADWLKSCKGNSRVALSPRSAEEVSAILSYCNDRKLAVCPQGGNTGLVGGSVPLFDEIILSTSRMSRVVDIDTSSGVAVCEAGCVLDSLDQAVSAHQLMVPLDLGSRGSCQLGGNVATNAGGLRVMRYGSLHGNVLGLEVVLADGKILDCLTTLRKDNTGYDLKQLFIGSEGTLGLITKVAILCPARPASVNIAFLGCNSMQEVLNTFALSKQMLGEVLCAFELMDQESLQCCQTHLKIKSPIEPLTRFPFYLLLETAGSNERHDEEKLLAFVQKALDTGLVKDGGAYTQPSQIKAIWSIRERITASTLLDGVVFKYDISLPLNVIYDVVLDLRERLGGLATRCVGFGHVGDGNLHVNVTAKPELANQVQALLEPYVFEWVSAHRGSISAEHGIGLQKVDYLHHSKSRQAIEVMRMLKRQFDPNSILNPYKVLSL